MCIVPPSFVSNTFMVHFEVFPILWVSKQNKSSQHYLAVTHHRVFVRLLTNSHVKKPRILELTPVFSAGCSAEPSYLCHPLLCCVLCCSGHGLHDAQVSDRINDRSKDLTSNMKRYLPYLYGKEDADIFLNAVFSR